MPPLNPPSRLSAAPTGACLPEEDGRLFSAVLQASRLAANAVADHYPNITDPNQLVSAYGSQQGQIVLSHLSAVMYSYWDNAPTGPAVYDLTADNLLDPFRDIFRTECKEWGTRRLNAPIGATLFVIADTPEGSIVADHSMNKFYKVLGMKSSPVATLKRTCVPLPTAVRLTALPFRGVLVYDGIMGGAPPRKLSDSETSKLRRRYAQAQRAGKIITGFHVDTNPHQPNSETHAIPERTISDLSQEEKEQVDRLKSVPKTDGMLIFRRFGYTQADNPNHLVAMLRGTLSCGMFKSARLVPSSQEILGELIKLGNSSPALPKMVAVDHKATATAVNEVTKHAYIHTALYPPPSVEEQSLMASLPPGVLDGLRGFTGQSGPFSNAVPQCPVQ